ncbi:MAG: hypothetical protein GY859_41430 [Desulfobacterales bacterium]|nr:hypothetical protein [Desulfobacterales bacterium]
MAESFRFDELNQKIDRYEESLTEVEKFKAKSPNTRPLILELLIARDDIEQILREMNDVDKTTFEKLCKSDDKLIALDERLKKKGVMIADTVSLEKWRGRFSPPEYAWWWFFSPSLPPWDRFDWVWNALTAGVLALTASYMYNIYSAIHVGNASITTTFSTIAQAAGLALIGGGALSDRGRKKVQNILESLKIPSRFFAEVTLGASLVILYSVYTANSKLDDHFLNKGLDHYNAGLLAEAALDYQQGSVINPGSSAYNQRLGEVYESLGSLDKAIRHYHLSVQEGHFKCLNDLGRAMINRLNPITGQPDPAMAEGILLLGLQRAQTRDVSGQLLYEINRNIGWALLNQEKYDRAEGYFIDAIALDKEIKENWPGGGMAYCFMAQVHEARGDAEKAKPMWQLCIDHARPEFIHEYKWFMQVKQDRIAYCIDTNSVVSGFAGKRSADAEKWCEIIRGELD